MSRPGAFVDRDGTINVDLHHVGRPEDVRLIPGAAAAIRRLNDAGVPVAVITNQGGIARGYFTAADFDRVTARLAELLAAEGARVDGTWHCPHYPSVTGPCDCRKPGVLLYQHAAAALDLDPRRSLYVGDRLRDIRAAETFGGLGVLVPSGNTPPEDLQAARGRFAIVDTLDDAVTRFLNG